MDNARFRKLVEEVGLTPDEVACEMRSLSKLKITRNHVASMMSGSRKVTAAAEIFIGMKRRSHNAPHKRNEIAARLRQMADDVEKAG